MTRPRCHHYAVSFEEYQEALVLARDWASQSGPPESLQLVAKALLYADCLRPAAGQRDDGKKTPFIPEGD